MSQSREPEDVRLRFGMDPPRLEEQRHWESLTPGSDERPTRYCECGCGVAIPATNRFVQGHNAVGGTRTTKPQYEVDAAGCWVWQRTINPSGYGMLNVRGKKSPQWAHRVFYERFKGPIPDGLQIDHLCRNRACVNPDHLELVTAAENTRRGAATKLDIDKVATIRSSSETSDVLAERFGVCRRTINQIRSGDRWAA